MVWRKLGQVFDTRLVNMPDHSVGFAQAPQALLVGDVVRVYFSTRVLDGKGQYVSRPAFVEYDHAFTKVLRVSAHDLLASGGLGCFDEHGVFPMTVVRVGTELLGYTTGWSRRVAVPVETAIGLVVSKDDGSTFERYGPGPIMGAGVDEPFLVGDGVVRVIGDTFHLWYIFGTAWRSDEEFNAPERTYKIGHATSRDGIEWHREGRQIISDRLGPDEAQAMPSVLVRGGSYEMTFCYRYSTDFRSNRARSYRIGYARSTDLVTWQRVDDPLQPGDLGEWDADMQCYPSLFARDDRTFLLYNGNEFGRYGFGVAVREE